VNFFGFWVLELPLAWVLSVNLHMETEGCLVAVVVAQAAIAGAGIVLFRRGRWARTEI
jgi:Na+-driven multidrug efflux pump